MNTIIVTAAIIRHNGQVLIAQRKQGAHEGLLWEFPGGKLESGESPEEGLIREIKEELDIDISVDDIFKVVSHCYDKERHVMLLVYLCQYLSGKPKTKDCQDFRWVTPDEMNHYTFAPADIPAVEKLKEFYKGGKNRAQF